MYEKNKRPIRILHMIGSLNIGGSQAMVMNLYRNIDRNKFQFDFIVDRNEELYYKKEIEKLGGRIFSVPHFTGVNIFQIINSWNLFFKQHPEYKVLHIHVRSYSSLFIPIAKKFGTKTIIHSHSTSNGNGISSIFKSILQFPLRFQADYFLSCSLEAGRWLFGRSAISKENFKIIKNAIDLNRFIDSNKNRSRIREELGIRNEFVLGFLARVTDAKNPNFVIKVFYELKKLNSNSKLLFVGDGNLLSEIKDKAKELNISDSIIFTGARSDVERMYSAMDFYILPSLWEGLGISLIEAQASGLVCICSENIQEEAIISESVIKMKLNIGEKNWAKNIFYFQPQNRKNNRKSIIRAGYDIETSVQDISNIYKKLIE
ncbi:glycosyltransferase [Lactococcus lactis]|uniref:glycosyltransferase n=1 Tax=Lactococcus lactis TaxID=1358 RepID=UPI003DA8EB30